ncbi:hypothetical protein POJ06DRAFT_265595 [Lipomyces tetrasporus]|uniref:HTH APSES-type domain-containing protein n=1 Tax=Lipomyces tetrasporus TaxID=54092 RepID=A0AAD7QWH6_9ASCO|nr:uncharacterized protein POJ06DRAFT_265595 [Lipomyces tetrasporus]KAJ8102734.1 hypothetical protein POJ06DRAFT_265595 [Lipomyces tetrasporus]
MSSVAAPYAHTQAIQPPPPPPPPPPQQPHLVPPVHYVPSTSSHLQAAPSATPSSQTTVISSMSQQSQSQPSQPSTESRTSTPHSQETPPPPQLAPVPTPSNIYTAVYSGIPVYEMMVNGVAVMRRRSDSYLNATQILKVGGVDKGRRTKILEKEIHTGEHEKVQGGYGKYQGTWIPFDRGRQFCRQYSVEDLLLPLLDFDPAAPQSEQTPTKEQALAARRKQMYAVASQQNSTASQAGIPSGSTNSVFATPLSTSATAALTALGKAAQSMSSASQAASVPSGDIKPLRASITNTHDHLVSFGSDMATDIDEDEGQGEDGPPRKRSRIGYSNVIGEDNVAVVESMSRDSLLTSKREQPLDPLDANTTPNFERSKDIMTQIFLTNETSGLSQLSVLDSVAAGSTGSSSIAKIEVDVAIDELGHTALHWASALARIQLVQDLVARRADPRRGNYAGETCLIRAVLVTNNYDQGSFPQLLDLLYPAITLADKDGRTVLHQIALTAGIKGRSGASRYYLECLLEWIVRHNGPNSTRKCVSLSRFMSDVVNAQDKNGDTSLNIAARIGNKSIAQQLIEVGADATIPNRAGLRPIDFGVGGMPSNPSAAPAPLFRTPGPLVPAAVAQKSKDIIASMTSMISVLDKDFQQELQTKQTTLDAMHVQLREVTVTLAQSRSGADQLRRQANRLNELHQRDRNLENAIREEDVRFKAVKVVTVVEKETSTETAAAAATAAEGEPSSDEVMTADETGDVTMADLDTIDSRSDDDNADVDADKAFRLEIVEEATTPAVNGPTPEAVPAATDSAAKEENTASATASISDVNTAAVTPATNPDPTPAAESSSSRVIYSNRLKVVGPVPPIPVLRARIAAYKRNAAHLSELAQVLRGRSSDLEDKFRGVVAMCTGVPKEDVDSLLEGLVQAVQSDPAEVDMSRVAGFLRNVDENP